MKFSNAFKASPAVIKYLEAKFANSNIVQKTGFIAINDEEIIFEFKTLSQAKISTNGEGYIFEYVYNNQLLQLYPK